MSSPAAADYPYWIGRPIEVPEIAARWTSKAGPMSGWSWRNGRPTTSSSAWPSTSPDDPADLRERQERQLLRLFDACRRTGHELLLEIIAPEGATVDDQTTANSLRRLYQIGIRPDWWKLEPTADARAWENIAAVIEENDPLCRGVVLLGLSAPVPDLMASFESAAPFPKIKGFAVGRTIFHDVAKQWLTGEVERPASRSRRWPSGCRHWFGHGAPHGPKCDQAA